MKNLIFITIIMFCARLHAQVPIEKGERSPDDGVFLTNEEAAVMIAEKKAADKLCKIESDFIVETEKQQCVLDKKILQNEIDYQKEKYEKIMKIKNDNEIELYRKISDSGNNIQWFTIGAASGAAAVVVSVLSVYLIIQSGK